MTNEDLDTPFVFQSLLDALVPGTWVRFRLGEREARLCEKCGYVVMENPIILAAYEERSGKVFQLALGPSPSFFQCPYCESLQPAPKGIYMLIQPHLTEGLYFGGFPAWAVELSPVEDPIGEAA